MLQDADRTLTAAVAETLDALNLAAEDAAAKRLARQYAETIDRAESAVADAQHILEIMDPEDVGGRIWLQKLEAKVTAQEVLDKLGPKLLAALQALGATPAARAQIRTAAKGGDSPANAPATRLDQLRQSRASRRAP